MSYGDDSLWIAGWKIRILRSYLSSCATDIMGVIGHRYCTCVCYDDSQLSVRCTAVTSALVMCRQKHLFNIRCGQTLSRYATQYMDKCRTAGGRWQLKQLGFGPVEGQRMVNITVSVFVSAVGCHTVQHVLVALMLCNTTELFIFCTHLMCK